MSDGHPTSWASSPKYMYQRIRVTSHGMVLKMVNPGINDQFYINPKHDRDCRNWPCKSTQEHSTSMNSAPCAYFRVFLRDCAIHSSRWVDFADFGLMGFRFFVLLVNMMRAFINKITARLRCVWVFVKLRSIAYATICCLPHMAIMCHHERGSKNIFRPHTEAFSCWRCAFFIPWTAGVNILSRVCESEYCFARMWKRTSWRAHRYAGCPWGRHGGLWDAIWVN
jgi:hypothetical protein